MEKSLTILATLLLLLNFAIADDDNEFGSSSARIRFQGEVLASKGCTIENIDDVIDMGSIYKHQLISVGHSEWIEGSIELIDCSLDGYGHNMVDAIELTVESGDADEDNPDLWKNEGDAEGVGIEIRITTYASIIVGPNGTDEPIEQDVYKYGDTASYKIEGRMVKTSDSVEPGSVEAAIHFKLNYK